MKSLFIFKSKARGMQYGMGTYIRELTQALLGNTGIEIYVVNYHNRECSEFSVDHISARHTVINIPSPVVHVQQVNRSGERYASSVAGLLSGIIPKNSEVFFQMNYLDDLDIIKKIKETYDYPVISMVHFAQWQQLFDGNRKKLAGLNIDNPSDNVEYTINREKEMYSISDHIISVTGYMKEFLISEYGIDACKIDVIHNGLDLSGLHSPLPEEKAALKKKYGFGHSERILLFSGRIDTGKGIFFLLDAFIEACRISDNLRLVIVGQGDIQVCLKRSDPYYGKITYTGFLSKEQLLDLYRIADLGIVPSVYDHCPYTVLEMMAFRIPLIASRINGLDEILDDSNSLFIDQLIDESGEISIDKYCLSEAMIELADNEIKRNNLADRAYETLLERFTSARMAKDMNSLLQKISEPEKVMIQI